MERSVDVSPATWHLFHFSQMVRCQWCITVDFFSSSSTERELSFPFPRPLQRTTKRAESGREENEEGGREKGGPMRNLLLFQAKYYWEPHPAIFKIGLKCTASVNPRGKLFLWDTIMYQTVNTMLLKPQVTTIQLKFQQVEIWYWILKDLSNSLLIKFIFKYSYF